MALDAGMSTEASEHIRSEVSFDRISAAVAGHQDRLDRAEVGKVDEVDKVDDDLPINPLKKIAKLEK